MSDARYFFVGIAWLVCMYISYFEVCTHYISMICCDDAAGFNRCLPDTSQLHTYGSDTREHSKQQKEKKKGHVYLFLAVCIQRSAVLVRVLGR